MIRSTFLVLILSLAAIRASGEEATRETLLIRQPALTADHLAFVYAGDLWVADRDGTSPRRLTSNPAEEHTPIFSPDGKWLAYAVEADGNSDVYVIAVEGGQPRRLTWHPGGDVPVDWTGDGKFIAFVSARETDHGRSGQLYHVALEGGAETKQMEARFFRGTYDKEGSRLAYIAFGPANRVLYGGGAGWRGYRGGTAPSIRILDLKNKSATKVPGERSSDIAPFWLDGKVYFLSDREDKTHNLYRFNPDNSRIEKLTDEKEWDVRSASGHGTTIVYEVAGGLKTFDLKTEKSRPLPIRINPDLPQLQPRWRSVSGEIQAIDISPSGVRALVTARGDVFSLPAKEGSPRNLSATDGVREYDAIWSPDGNQIAWIVESMEGQTLVLSDQQGNLAERRYPLGPHFYSTLAWHAGKKRIVFQDNHLGLFWLDLESGTVTRIGTNARRDAFEAVFSPDGRWLAYTLERANFNRDLMLHDFTEGKDTRVSDGMADVASPAFSRDGKVLYFAASTNSGPVQVGLNMSSQERPYRAGIYAAVLTADGASPIAPKPGDEKAEEKKEEKKKEEKGDEKPSENGGEEKEEAAPASEGEKANGEATKEDEKQEVEKNGEEKKGEGKGKAEEVAVALEGIERRIVGLPVPEGNYGSLQVGEDGSLYYLEFPQPGETTPLPETQPEAGSKLYRFDFKENKTGAVFSDLLSFRVSANGKKAILRFSGNRLSIAELGASLKPESVDLSGLRMKIDPRREWGQIFDEAWRMEKEFFYADNMHGLDWDAVYARYRPLLDHVGRREDLNDLLAEIVAEMCVGHNNVGGGDVYRAGAPRAGLLGANFTVDSGRYKIAKIYSGEMWNPHLAGPLAVPGQQAKEGEYLLAIAGREITAEENLFERLENTAGQQLTLRVGPNADGTGARDIVVKPIGSEGGLRLWNWVERNRKWVEEKTDGKVGYVYMPDTAGGGYTFFNRMFHNQIDKEAMILDERANGGGQAADYIVETLSRRHLSGWKDRDGLPYNTPAEALHAPKLMMIDQDAGSGGDYLPYAFRELKIGPLLGTRTWGGLIGISANPPLVDGGVVTVPFFRFYDTEGKWTVENEGVAPDIEVELDPVMTNQGRDAQLERAVEEILKMLKGHKDGVRDEAPELPTELGK